MKTLTFVWGFVAFTILGLEFLSQTEYFDALQDFESNFNQVNHPEEFLPDWSANDVRANASRVYQAKGEGINGSHALGIQAIGSFDAEIYTKTTTKDLNSNRISLKVKTKRNGSGNRPVSIFYSFSENDSNTYSSRQQIGDNGTFENEDGIYQEFDFLIPDPFLEKELVTIKLDVTYGEGNGSATQIFIDDFTLHGLLTEQPHDPLQILSIEPENGKTLAIQFNQPVTIDSATNLSPVVLNQDYGQPQKITAKDHLLFLEFADYIYSNHYQLHFEKIISLTTDEIWQDTTHTFDLVSPTPPGSIFINEIMADPNPKGLIPQQASLPSEASHEYIELFNAADHPIWLKGFSYNEGTLEESTVPAGGFVVIASPANKGLFSSFGEVVAAAPFRALPNSSGHISLKDAFGNVSDSLTYSLNWYRDTQKQSGGWALERINPYLACSDQDNWSASTSPQGGTPGRINSVFDDSPDNRPFLITKVQVISKQELSVTFSKPLQQESVQDVLLTIDGKNLSLHAIYPKAVHLNVPFELTSGKTYELQVNNLWDCSGMALNDESYSFIYDAEGPLISRTASLAPDELLLFYNEAVLASTALTLENYLVNQETDKVKSAVLKDSVTVQLLLNEALELDQNHSLSAKNLQDLHGNVSGEQNIEFFLDDQFDTVIWRGNNLLDLHFRTELDSSSVITKSFSVDKNIGSPIQAYINAENQKLIHLVFGQNLPQNTPGTITVHHLKNSSSDYINTHKKTFFYDNRAISINSVDVGNDSTVTVVFNKPISPEYASIKNNYFINGEIGHPLYVKPTSPDTVVLTVNTLSEGENYTLSISGLQDIFGIKITRPITRNFSFDVSGPRILEAYVISPYEIHLIANEAIQHPEHYNVKIDGEDAAQVKAVSESEFIITTKGELAGNIIELILQELTDINGNLSETIVIDIPNDKIALGKAIIIKEDKIQLTFTARIEPLSSSLSSPFKVNSLNPHEVLVLENQYEVILSLNKPLTLMDSVSVEIESIKSQNGKETHPLAYTLWYDDQIEDLFAINPQLIQVVHKIALDKQFTEESNFSLKDQTIQLEPLVNLSDPHILQLVSNQPLIPDIAYELVLPARKSLPQKHIPGSVRTLVYDKSPPRLVAVESLNENEILVSFDEALDPILSIITAFYSLNGEEPLEAIPGNIPHQVTLVFPLLHKDQTYTLTVTQLEDLHRNAITEEKIDFVFDGPVSPSYREIIINEIMAAPREGQELPEVEYVELFNASLKELFLGGLSLANSRSSTVLPRATILPGEFLILAPTGRLEELGKFGPVLGLNNWPTLLNNGDEVRLLSRDGIIVDEVIYSTASYGSPEKAQGGFSLEVVNPFAVCPDTENLKPSASTLKGTPGQINSVFDDTPDRTLPMLIRANLLNDTTIRLDFSEVLNTEIDKVQVHTAPSLSTKSHFIDQTDPTRLIVIFNEPVKENFRYQITIESLKDCSGNFIDPNNNTAFITLPLTASAGNIVLNEILFNPKTGVPKFVEIYNRSAKFVDLKDWKLANAVNGEIANRRVISSEQTIIAPFSFIVFTTDASLLKQAYPKGKEEVFLGLSSLPSYPIGRGTVALLNAEEDLVEKFDYDEKFHHSLLDDVKGVSLERLSLEHGSNDPKNWHSASFSEGNATPGYMNSQAHGESLLNKGITISPEVFVPDAPGVQNFTTISYQMDHPGFVVTLRIYSIAGQLVKEICQNDVWGISGFYTWDGTNLSGSKVRPGFYIVWVEALNLDGRVENIKKTVVVGSKF